MRLPKPEVEQFYRVLSALLNFANRELEVIVAAPGRPAGSIILDPEDMMDVRDALLENRALIDEFAEANPDGLDEADRELARSWRDVVAGAFFVHSQGPDGAIFLSEDEPVVAYRVLTQGTPFNELVGEGLPRLVGAALFPIHGRIVTDGFLDLLERRVPVATRRRLDAAVREIEGRGGIVASLPAPAGPGRAESPVRADLMPKPKPKGRGKATPADGASPADAGKVPAAAREAYDRIVGRLDAFCREHLDEEYAGLCRRMAAALARKRPAPILRGKPKSWAAGIVQAVGFANFLGDPSQPHHMRMSDVARAFGVSEATGANKGMLIRNLLGVDRLGVEWTLRSRMAKNPLIWLLKVNGLIVDIRDLPREAQEVAYRQGLIPYIPADRGEGSGGDD